MNRFVTVNRLIIALALWLGAGPLVTAQAGCPEDHACCKVAKKKSCCSRETDTPVIPVVPQCQCTGHEAPPASASRSEREAGPRQSVEKVATASPWRSLTLKARQVSESAVDFSSVPRSHVALFRLTVRWRC